jgi:hypothetical protein
MRLLPWAALRSDSEQVWFKLSGGEDSDQAFEIILLCLKLNGNTKCLATLFSAASPGWGDGMLWDTYAHSSRVISDPLGTMMKLIDSSLPPVTPTLVILSGFFVRYTHYLKKGTKHGYNV